MHNETGLFYFSFGKVELPKPSLLVHCPEGAILCGSSQKVEAPCDYTGAKSCMWSNVSYKAVSNGITNK